MIHPVAPEESIAAGTTEDTRDVRAIRAAALYVVVVALWGIFGTVFLRLHGAASVSLSHRQNVFFRLFALHEWPLLILLVAFVGAAWWYVVRADASHAAAAEPRSFLSRLASPTPLALAVLLVAAVGTRVVMHSIGLSMDEYAATFQARIFSSGHVTATIPQQWWPLAPWMTPIFINYKSGVHGWVAAYLPGYAAMRALMSLARIEWLTNPLLAAGSVLLLDRIARRLWPSDAGEDERRALALVYLVTSSQFLVMSMSGYSMSAHLCLNLLWLLLYLRDDTAGYAALPWVGVLALGLHNPFPHALFAAPLLLRLVRRHRFKWAAYTAVVYLAGVAFWLKWLSFARQGIDDNPNAVGLLQGFALPTLDMGLIQGLNANLLLSWQTPALAIALFVAMICWRRLATIERDLLAGVVLTFAFYFLFPASQGHGWGYRYIFGVLGNIVLLGAAGTAIAARELPRSGVRAVVAASVLVSLALQLPLRFWQTERVVGPTARALEFIATQPEPLVAVDYMQAWYASDLVRNDPLFERGPISFAWSRSDPSFDAVPQALRDSVILISRPQMARFGMPLYPLPRRAKR